MLQNPLKIASSWHQLYHEPHGSVRPVDPGGEAAQLRREGNQTHGALNGNQTASLCCFFCLLIRVSGILFAHANDAFKV